MRKPARVRIAGPLAPYAAGFGEELARIGYTPGSACRLLNLMANASGWLASRGLGIDDLGSVQVEEFCRSRREEGYVGHRSTKAMSPLLGYLGQLGVITTEPPRHAQTAVDKLIEHYAGYLVAERGVAPATVRSYARVARQFLSQLSLPTGLDLGGLTAEDVVEFDLRSVLAWRAPRRPA